MEEYLITLTIIAIVFIVGFLLGFKQGSKFVWKKLLIHKLLREDVDADVIKVEYIDFVKEEIEDKTEKV